MVNFHLALRNEPDGELIFAAAAIYRERVITTLLVR